MATGVTGAVFALARPGASESRGGELSGAMRELKRSVGLLLELPGILEQYSGTGLAVSAACRHSLQVAVDCVKGVGIETV